MSYADMGGKVCIVTGANSGIGKVTALELAKANAIVVMACRNEERGNQALEEIVNLSGNRNVELYTVDLSSMQQIRDFVNDFSKKHDKLNVLINNAGLVLGKRVETVDSLEYVFAVNYFAPFLLTNLLLDKLRTGTPSRVVNVSADLHKIARLDLDDLQSQKKYSAIGAYGKSKIALNMFTFLLAKKVEKDGITVNALHPGVILSNFGKVRNSDSRQSLVMRVSLKIFSRFMLSPEQGADTMLYLATSSEVAGITGKYYKKHKIAKTKKECQDEEKQRALWELSEKRVGLKQQ
ncbi:MAG: SDR family oxidoreductase [Candidatus Hodarchaeota archaeon]